METSNLHKDEVPAKVILWCTPRSLSTVITKCISFVPNTDIWFEPFIDAYRFGSDAQYPDPNWVEQNISPVGHDVGQLSYMWCQKQLENSCRSKKNVFVKDMAFAIDGRYDAIPSGYKHTFLIRHPAKVIRSWKKAIYTVSDGPFDEFKLSSCPPSKVPPGIFFEESYNLYNYIKAHFDPSPVVIDSDELLLNPSGVLKAYSSAVGMAYKDELLTWETSSDIIKTWKISKKNLQVFSKTHYATALSSSEFMKPKQILVNDLSKDDKRCVEICMPFYKTMFNDRLRV